LKVELEHATFDIHRRLLRSNPVFILYFVSPGGFV
jgi:hypothetical protein